MARKFEQPRDGNRAAGSSPVRDTHSLSALRYRFNDWLGLLATVSQGQLPGKPTFRPNEEKRVSEDLIK